MALQILGFLNDERLKHLVIFLLILLAAVAIITAIVYPRIEERKITYGPDSYTFYRGYCESRTSECYNIHRENPNYDCSFRCQVCLRVGETAYNNCINA
ncbi:hypothetical protein DRN74_02560 [Candidatus Micrarchaeota archaeon]|nr:MAG: hypothetical protein DRN74_02560 [Candidatus Micrarchaeota archaeon]